MLADPSGAAFCAWQPNLHRGAQAVVVAPYDAPPTRLAVLSDPQGAQFSVSKYEPEH